MGRDKDIPPLQLHLIPHGTPSRYKGLLPIIVCHAYRGTIILSGILPSHTSLALNQIGDFDTNSDTNADTFRETLGNKQIGGPGISGRPHIWGYVGEQGYSAYETAALPLSYGG